jgi:hypothetical protein
MSEHAAQRRATEPKYVLRVLDFFTRMGSAEAIVHGEHRYTYTETRAAVLAMATALTGRGVRGGMTVAALTRNHPESIILLLACTCSAAGRVSSPATHRARISLTSSPARTPTCSSTTAGSGANRSATHWQGLPARCSASAPRPAARTCWPRWSWPPRAARRTRAPGTGVTAAGLRGLVARELGEAHAPRDVEFVAELPMTHEDKVDKKALRVRYHHG